MNQNNMVEVTTVTFFVPLRITNDVGRRRVAASGLGTLDSGVAGFRQFIHDISIPRKYIFTVHTILQ